MFSIAQAAPDLAAPTGASVAVEAVDLSRRYGDGDNAVQALHSVSLQVPAGQYTAVMGPSGSGKSTLMHLLAGLDRPTAGRVHVGGQDITEMADNALTRLRREHVGFVFQAFNLLPTLTAEENIVLPARIAGRKLDPGAVDLLLERVGLAGRRDHKPSELSGGQQQRVAVARALITQPTILFADEPTGNLDSRAGAEILALLREAVDTDGQTILMVTHDPRAAAQADRVVFLADGQVVRDMADPTEDGVLAAMAEIAPMIKVGLQALAARRARTALTMLAIVLGVAMVASAFTVTDTMRKAADSLSAAAYDGTDAVVTGRSALTTTATNEWMVDKPKVSADLLAAVRAVPEVGVAVGDVTDQNTKLIGTDGKPIGQGPYFGIGFDARTTGADRVNPMHLTDGRWATGPGEVVLDAGSAAKAHAKVGSTVRITTDRVRGYRVTGVANFGSVRSLGTATVAVFDLAVAQRELHRDGRYDSILVAGRPGTDPAAVRAAVARALPSNAAVTTAAADDRFGFDGLKTFIDIIKIALLVFGGVAVLVGAFTIFNALSITVAQRSRELGLLRLVGASRRQVLGSVLVEALALGVVASVAGVVAGYGLAKGLTALLASLGLKLPDAGMVFGAGTVVTSMLVGIVVTTLAGIVPAIRATRVAPVEVLRAAAAREPRRIGRAVRSVVSLLGRPAERLGGTAGGLARHNAMRNPGRTMSTALALTIGVALVTLVTVVAAGLKSSATTSLERRVSADHVVHSTDGWTPVDRSIVGELSGVGGVRAVSGIVQDGGRAYGNLEQVNGIDPVTLPQVFRFDWAEGDDQVPSGLGARGAIVDEGFAKKHRLQPGSTFELTSAKGTTLHLTVRGIERSPALDALGLGPITIGRAAYDDAFANRRPSLTFVAAEGSALPALRHVLAAHPDAELQDTAAWIKDRAGQVDQLVAIFGALLALAVIVSLFGIVNTLVLSTFERTRELGMLRAVGMTRRQMPRMVRHESIITALLGALTGIAAGLGLAAVVTAVFADDGLEFAVPVGTLIAFTVVAVLAGVLAAVAPARRAARLSPLAALAYE